MSRQTYEIEVTIDEDGVEEMHITSEDGDVDHFAVAAALMDMAQMICGHRSRELH